MPFQALKTNPRPLVLLLIGLSLTGCVTAYEREQRFAPRRLSNNCEPVSMSANAETRSQARAIAINSLKLDAADVRGAMISGGLRRIRVTERDIRCRPYALAPSRTECTASVVLCGR